MSAAAALLAGGRSRRMGVDKAFLKWGGRPLWELQLGKLLKVQESSPVLVASRPEQELAAAVLKTLGKEVGQQVRFVDDPPGADNGPLGAVVRCLEVLESGQALIVLGLDLPCLSEKRLRWLAKGPHGGQGAFFLQTNLSGPGATGKDSSAIYEPLAARYTTAMLPLLRAALAERRLSLQGVIREAVEAGLAAVVAVPESERAEFHNVNLPEDLEAEPNPL